MSLPHIQLMTRRNCCLCDDAKAVLEVSAAEGLCSWEAVDVDRDKALLVRFGLDVPVLVLDGAVLFKHRVTQDSLTSALAGLD
ncbi:glutaredoxin family protein [Mariprofundus sp. KV]|uniref:glutaredoxin family protein n=1 Tax=Mariprofundus sp. KV TaxID=2608715 RepID=UPI0015A0CDA9|nr:glutaredoxin family protein [Mariprofundus sp. KV]NWF35267.1 glutaredoxin family protein [Mariprofundus sp. KV]